MNESVDFRRSCSVKGRTCSGDKTALHSDSDLLIVVIFLSCDSVEGSARRRLLITMAGMRA